MAELVDRVTRYIGIALNLLFVGYPTRTSLGVLIGVVIYTLAHLLKPMLSQLSGVLDFAAIGLWQYLVIGVVISHLQTIRFYLLKKGTMLGENEEKALEILKRAKQLGVPEWRLKNMYIELCEKVLRNVEVRPPTDEDKSLPDRSEESDQSAQTQPEERHEG